MTAIHWPTIITCVVVQACSEASLFKACVTWGDVPGRDISEVEQLLPLIRFPLMTQQELQASALTQRLLRAAMCLRMTAACVYTTAASPDLLYGIAAVLGVSRTDSANVLQMVCEHPLAAHSAQLQQLIAEAMAAQQESHALSPRSQVTINP